MNIFASNLVCRHTKITVAQYISLWIIFKMAATAILDLYIYIFAPYLGDQ